MPERETIERAREDAREGKAPSTQAGEFVREEIHHVREGKHGARSTKQAIAIGLSKARRAGVKLPATKSASKRIRTQAKRELARARKGTKKVSRTRSKAVRSALRREGHSAASKTALAKHARSSARKRSASQRSASAKKAARTRARHR
jgi:glucose-6-phosphate-specific signal transduction histidine kinase